MSSPRYCHEFHKTAPTVFKGYFEKFDVYHCLVKNGNVVKDYWLARYGNGSHDYILCPSRTLEEMRRTMYWADIPIHNKAMILAMERDGAKV